MTRARVNAFLSVICTLRGRDFIFAKHYASSFQKANEMVQGRGVVDVNRRFHSLTFTFTRIYLPCFEYLARNGCLQPSATDTSSKIGSLPFKETWHLQISTRERLARGETDCAALQETVMNRFLLAFSVTALLCGNVLAQ